MDKSGWVFLRQSLLTVGVPIILVFAIGIEHALADPTTTLLEPRGFDNLSNSEKTAPKLKDEVIQPITVTVDKPANTEVWFAVRYQAKDARCDRFNAVLYFETGRGKQSREYSNYYQVPIGTNNIVVQLPVDRFQAGECQWTPIELKSYAFDPRYEQQEHPGYGTFANFRLDEDGAESEEFDQSCYLRGMDLQGRHTSYLSCQLAKGQMQPHALRPFNAKLHLKFETNPYP